MERGGLRGTRAVAARAGQDTAGIERPSRSASASDARRQPRRTDARAGQPPRPVRRRRRSPVVVVAAATSRPCPHRQPLGGTRARRAVGDVRRGRGAACRRVKPSAPALPAATRWSSPGWRHLPPRRRRAHAVIAAICRVSRCWGSLGSTGLHRDELGGSPATSIRRRRTPDPGGDIGVDECAGPAALSQRRRTGWWPRENRPSFMNRWTSSAARDGDVDLTAFIGADLRSPAAPPARRPGRTRRQRGSHGPWPTIPACPRAGLPLPRGIFAMSKPSQRSSVHASTSPH